MSIETPKIDDRNFKHLLEEIKQLIPYYTPEWQPSNTDEGIALVTIFTHMVESNIQRLNRVPMRVFFEFLDMLGIDLMPPQPARVPVTFFLSEDVEQHVTVPAGTQMAAEEVVFETENNFHATPARLCQAYTCNPAGDEIYECPLHILSGKPVAAFQTRLEHKAGKGDRHIFVKNSHGLQPEDILAIGGTGHKEYCMVREVSDFAIHLEEVLEADYDRQSSVCRPVHFMVSEGRNIQEHVLYFGHKDIFNVTSESVFILHFKNSRLIDKLKNPDNVQWEYWGESEKQNGSSSLKETGWHLLDPLHNNNVGSKNIRLRKTGEGEIKERKINDIESRWLRCRLNHQKIDVVKDFEVDTVTVSNLISHEAEPLLPDMAFYNDVAIDMTPGNGQLKEEIFPFGRQPRVSDAFYMGCNEAFSKKGMRVTLSFMLYSMKDIPVQAVHGIGDYFAAKLAKIDKTTGEGIGTIGELLKLTPEELKKKLGTNIKRATNILEAAQKAFYDKSGEYGAGAKGKVQAKGKEELQLSWEYWNGNGWTVIENLDDRTEKFLKPGTGTVVFTCPDDIARTRVSGQENYWIRIRLVSGDYGRELVFNGNQWVPGLVSPPAIRDIKIEYIIEPVYPNYCLVDNNCEITDFSNESKTAGTRFTPYQIPEDNVRTLFLGFDKKLEKGPISVFFSLVSGKSLIVDMPKIEWYYFSQSREWKILDILDDTHNLTRKGLIEFFIPPDFERCRKFGRELYWIKACFKKEYEHALPVFKGMYVNTTYATQVESITDEIMGSGNGTQHQIFTATKAPVLTEQVWINEKRTLSEDERKCIIAGKGEDAVRDLLDGSGEIVEIWVKWEAVEALFNSSPRDRYYEIDRTSAVISFGDGVHGMIPPAGKNNIKVCYRTGGGERGNISASELTTLKTSIPYVDRVNNFEPGEGGANTESITEVSQRGPQQIRHRNRAVSEDDFERITMVASRFIARTKCLVHYNTLKVIVIPKGEEDKPVPSFELMKTVEKYILSQCINTIPSECIVVEKPSYLEVNVTADVVPTSMDIAASLEKETVERLRKFLHPVTGGPEKAGWEFGRYVHLSDVYALLENIPGVDHVENILLNGQHRDVIVDQFSTVCSGQHSVHIRPGGRYHGAAHN